MPKIWHFFSLLCSPLLPILVESSLRFLPPPHISERRELWKSLFLMVFSQKPIDSHGFSSPPFFLYPIGGSTRGGSPLRVVNTLIPPDCCVQAYLRHPPLPTEAYDCFAVLLKTVPPPQAPPLFAVPRSSVSSLLFARSLFLSPWLSLHLSDRHIDLTAHESPSHPLCACPHRTHLSFCLPHYTIFLCDMLCILFLPPPLFK